MNRKDLYRSFNNVDDDNLEHSETSVYKKNRTWIKWASIAACFFLIVSGLIVLGRRNPTAGGGNSTVPGYYDGGLSLIPGFYDIYPTVMVDGELYEWLTGCNFMPKGCVYYGEVKHVTTEAPQKNCELASVFDIEGEIYTHDGVYVYIRATTDWLDEKVIIFKRVKNG